MKRQTFRALLGAALVLGAAGRSAASPYTITVLDGNDGSLTFPLFLNNLGQVAGTWNQFSGPHGAGGDHPFFYDPTAGGKVTLPGIISPSGQNPGSYAFPGWISGLNDLGQVVGTDNTGTFLYDSKTGQMTSLPGPAGLITNSGEVIGTEQVAPLGGWANFHPYSDQNGSLQDLGVPPGAVGAQVQAANHLGQVLVQAAMTPGAFDHSFLLSGGKWTDLGNFYGAAINDQGTIAGNTGYVAGQPTHAAVIPAGGSPIDLGTLPGDTFSSAYGINNQGQVVGLSFSQNSTNLYQGFLYQNGVMTNLNSLLPANSGWTIRWGLAINDQGQILALGENGSEQVVLLTPPGLPTPPDPVFPEMPVPEPSTFVVFGCLAGALGWRASCRWGRKATREVAGRSRLLQGAEEGVVL
ncbi:MAG TPA: hypothetical protein VFF52_12200 [Isosphaeraceae bacterium]|nr:hypothetical protein [Isosphaeraceae bacterium]